MTEQQRLIWLSSKPACAETNPVFQEFTGVPYNSGEQNNGMTKARQTRNMKLRKEQSQLLRSPMGEAFIRCQLSIPAGDAFTIDSRALLHRISWPRRSATCQYVCGLYRSYVAMKYGNLIVIFYGYDEMYQTTRRNRGEPQEELAQLQPCKSAWKLP